MTTSEESPERLSPAVEVFAEFLALQEQQLDPDFDAFCAEHPDLTPKLRRLHARWRELMGAFDDPAVERSLSDRIEQKFGEGVHPAVFLDELAKNDERPGRRYEDSELVARGGMGEIRKIWDANLRRTLAMKVLLSGEDGSGTPSTAQSDPRSLSRFLEEAQITAQLEHPGIVPVHELGLDESGRVFFTMTLVRGSSLKEVLACVREERDGWTITRALGVILRVCEAVAFAHTKGVIHRDLKPANVMVGRFGETYVMDWGLARVLGQGDRTGGTDDIQSSRREFAEQEPDSPLVTLQGDVVGTPAYMAPEQARGDVEQVGPRADVYSIGAMLYHLLSGQMPYLPASGRTSSRTVLGNVLDGPPRQIRAVAPAMPAELCAICERAMEREPEDRYPGVLELADDLRAFLEMRVVRAYETGTWAELKKWVRRNKALSLASTAAVVALAVGLLFSLVEKSRADEHAAKAEASFNLAFEAIDRMLTRVGDKTLADVPQMDAVRKEVLREALEFNRGFLAIRKDDPSVRTEVARAHARVGVIHWKLGELDEAEEAQKQAISQFTALVDDNPGNLELRGELVWSRNALGTYVMVRGRAREGQVLLEEALGGLRELAERYRDKPLYRERQAVALNNLAVAHHRQSQTERALECAVEALGIRESLAREFPENALYEKGAAKQCINVGYMYERLKRDAEAESVYEKGVRAMRGLLEDNKEKRSYREDLSKLLNNLGIVQMKTGADATTTLKEAVDINRRLLAEFSDVPAYHASLGGSLSNLGNALRGLRQFELARTHLEEAVAETKTAYEVMPDDPQVRLYLGNQYPKLCDVLARLKQPEALAQRTEEYLALGFLARPKATHRAARNYALCADLTEKDGDLAERHADRAVELLRQAVEEGFADAAALDHPEFAALRGREDFARIKAALASKVRDKD